jgi:hypothetical protein
MRHVTVILAAVFIFQGAQVAPAAVLTFTIDSELSSLSSNSTVSVFGNPLPSGEQGPGSLTADVSGTIYADVTATSFEILPGSVLIVGDSGSWLPNSDYSDYETDPTYYLTTPEAANYGYSTNLTAIGHGASEPSAARYIQIALDDSSPKTLTGGTFDETGTDTEFVSGTVFYSVGAAPPITDMTLLAPSDTLETGSDGSLSTLGSVMTLSLLFANSTTYLVAVLSITNNLSGTIVATAAVPEPGSIALLFTGLGAAGFVLARRRRRCKQEAHHQ